ncbi:HEAT repeat domain-containing protein [Dysgonomonas sp. Marseille-P4677]|uniref:HEAT repeat domain-containing protein n=1 Tax=Dysgonomonas sp. Marseille-P4677 TaxID=2364790 RepID=UPI00191396D1|nr:HEAT repeat domain-containing protein [Dysgonomonas sp. Marseille-P4677]MBK5720627.1 HEAT repeat domain-containing protein [Dysgonomonas sp. Marseille-P4677]
MKIQPLYDLQQEINRLFIAGSKFAKGDPRLQKHIIVFSKLGEKVPVFKKIATDLEDLSTTDVQASPEKLMNISTLLYSVLYTQGEGIEPDQETKEQIPGISIDEVNTEYSYLQLKPVMDALTTSNSGRLEVLKDAFERNIFNDSRTYNYLDFALGDKYGELCQYIEQTIIPKIGKPMIPFLLQGFAYEDKAENARRLRLLNQLGYPNIREMIDAILVSSLPVLRAEAVVILGDDIENEEQVIQLADDKNKQVREAAYNALVKLNSRKSLEKLKDIYLKSSKNKANLQLVTSALAFSKLPFFFQEVFNQVVDSYEAVLALDKSTEDKVLVDTFEKFTINLDALNNKEQPETLVFVERVLTDKQLHTLLLTKKSLLESMAHGITNRIIAILNSKERSKILSFYEKNINDIPDSSWKKHLWYDYFVTANEVYSPSMIFDTFSPQFINEANTISMNALFKVYSDYSYYHYYDVADMKVNIDKTDSRWGKLLFKCIADSKWNESFNSGLLLLNALQPKNKELDELLINLTKRIAPIEQITIFEIIMLRKIKGGFDAICSSIEKLSRNTYFYALHRLLEKGFWTQFPKEYAKRFRTMYEKSKVEIYNKIADEIEGQ